MAIRTQVDAILNKKMDRQDFLKHVAMGVVAISGASAVLRVFSPTQKSASSGYGGAAYGGVKLK